MDKFAFKDTEGRTWVVPELKLSHLMKLNEKCGIELGSLITERYLWTDTDQAMICIGASLWCFCQGQHDTTEEQFFESFDGDVIHDSQSALAERVVNFCRSHRRERLKEVLTLMGQATDKDLEIVDLEIEKLRSQLSKSASDEEGKQESPIPDLLASEN